MSELNPKTMSELYEKDFVLWLETTAQLLKAQDFQNLDLPNLIEEVESLGREQKRLLTQHLQNVCEHLLKLTYWESERETHGRQWMTEITYARMDMKFILEDSPSLSNYLIDEFIPTYQEARELFLILSDFDPHLIPNEPDFTLAQALDDDWFPWQPN